MLRRGSGRCLLFFLPIGLAFLASSCGGGKHVGGFDVRIRDSYQIVQFDQGNSSFEVSSSCGSGEQLLGGAYKLDQPAIDATPVEVEGSYPSDGATWTVSYYNPDTDSSGPNQGTLVTTEAFCLTTSNFPVNETIQSTTGAASSATQAATVSAMCPPGAVLTGGGFRTEYSSDQGLYNAWVDASTPLLAGNAAIGWRAVQYIIDGPIPPLTTYALCAGKNLTAASTNSAETKITPSFRFIGVTVPCRHGEFTTGGGFEFPNDEGTFSDLSANSQSGDWLTMHHVHRSDAGNALSWWTVRGIYELDDRDTSDDLQLPGPADGQTPETTGVKAWVVCIKIPVINELTVKITAPANGSSFGVPFGQSTTAPITFTAIAHDANGNPITGTNLTWTDNQSGMIGTGTAFTKTLDGNPCGIAPHTITVKATDSAGNFATDSIVIYVGGTC